MNVQVSFIDKEKTQFSQVLRKRVDAFMKEQSIQKVGGWRMVPKTIIMLSMYFIPYALIMTGSFNAWFMLAMCVMMGIGYAGIGMSVMHDANHGSYTNNNKLNDAIGYVLNLLGGNSFNWKMQHNYLHHSFTNIAGMDDDIRSRGLLRFEKTAPSRPIHRFQHIYGFLLYGLMTLMWVSVKDIRQVLDYNKRGLVKKNNTTLAREITIISVSKIIYLTYSIVLPMIFLNVAWWQVLIGFFTLHYVGGLILSIIFQLAHVVEKVEFPTPDEKGIIYQDWSAHQLMTTADFGHNNPLLSWYCGGLNYQVEHHLFPRVSHLHYPKIAKIVKQTAQEYGVPYNEYPSFTSALISHLKTLKRLGHGEQVVTQTVSASSSTQAAHQAAA